MSPASSWANRRVRARAVPADALVIVGDQLASARRSAFSLERRCVLPAPATNWKLQRRACGIPGQEGGADGRVSTSADPAAPERSSTRRSRLLAVAISASSAASCITGVTVDRRLWHDGGAQRRRSRHLTSSAHRRIHYAHPAGRSPLKAPISMPAVPGAADSTHRRARTARRSVNGHGPERSEIGRATSFEPGRSTRAWIRPRWLKTSPFTVTGAGGPGARRSVDLVLHRGLDLLVASPRRWTRSGGTSDAVAVALRWTVTAFSVSFATLLLTGAAARRPIGRPTDDVDRIGHLRRQLGGGRRWRAALVRSSQRHRVYRGRPAP